MAAVGTTVAAHTKIIPGAYAQGKDEIRVGVVGVGGRGTGAIQDVLMAAPGVKIVAVADAFKDRIDELTPKLKKFAEDPEIKKHGTHRRHAREHVRRPLRLPESHHHADVNYIIPPRRRASAPNT